MGRWYSFRDPVHGYIKISEAEERILRHSAFQRLRRIKQLGMTFYVYHGAEHSRFTHCLGMMEFLSKALDSIRKKDGTPLHGMTEEEYAALKQRARLAALLHDVGHPAFSHSGDERVLFPEGLNHEDYSTHIIEHVLHSELQSQFGIRSAEVNALIRGRVEPEQTFVRELIDGDLDTDKMDYLLRDSMCCGVNYGRYDHQRLLETLTAVEHGGHWRLAIESDGVHAVEEFMFARYWMFLQVYFHKTRRIYDHILTEFLKEYLQDGHFPNLDATDQYLSIDDVLIWNEVQKKTNWWANCLAERKHLSEVYVSKAHPATEDKAEFLELKERFSETFDDARYAHVDQASKVTAELQVTSLRGTAGDEQPFIPVLVLDKHAKQVSNIVDYSVPLNSIGKINVFRFYADKQKYPDAEKFCAEVVKAYQDKLSKLG